MRTAARYGLTVLAATKKAARLDFHFLLPIHKHHRMLHA